MPNNVPTTEANRSSILNLKHLLITIIKDPRKFVDNDIVRASLKSQGRMAALEFVHEAEDGTSMAIRRVSLNTLKSYSNILFSDGFKGLDELRTRAATACENAEKRSFYANKRTKSGLLMKVTELENDLESHKKINLILLQALSSALSDFKNIRDTSDPKLRAKRAEDASKVLKAIIGMTPLPTSALVQDNSGQAKSTVIDMSTYREKP